MMRFAVSETCVKTVNEAHMYSRILHVTDLSSNHFHLCQQALEIALKFDAQLFLLHVITPPASLQLAQGLGFAEFDAPVIEDAQVVLFTIADALNIPQNHTFVESGAITTHTFEKINDLTCDLLIVGSHTLINWPTILGNTARSLVESAPCDVLTLKVAT